MAAAAAGGGGAILVTGTENDNVRTATEIGIARTADLDVEINGLCVLSAA